MSTTTTTTQRITWYIQDCIRCGTSFGVTGAYDDRRRADKRSFYCPNGHLMSYTESEADRLRKKLAAAEGNLKAQTERTKRARESTEAERRRHSATKGQLTKTKKRISGGVCPCCNRSFINLGRHMAGQHPDYTTDDDAPTVEHAECGCGRRIYRGGPDGTWAHTDRRVTSHPAVPSGHA